MACGSMTQWAFMTEEALLVPKEAESGSVVLWLNPALRQIIVSSALWIVQ